MLSDADSALHYLILAEQLMVAQDSCQEFAIQVYLQLARAFYISGEYASAFEINYKALRCADKTKYIAAKAKALNQIGSVLNMQEKFQEALAYQNQALELAEMLGDSSLRAAIVLNTGIVHVTTEEFEKSKPFLKQSIDYYRNTKNYYMLSKALNHLGNAEFYTGNLHAARQNFGEVIDKYEAGNDWEVCYAYEGLSRLSLKEDSIDAAIRYAQKGMDMAIGIHARWDILQLTKAYENALLAKGNYKEAYLQAIHYHKYWEELFNEQQEEEINYLWVKLKDAENVVLRAENSTLQKNQTLTNRFLIALAAFFLLLILYLVLLVRKNRLQDKFYHILEAKNAENRKINEQLEASLNTKDKLFRIIAHDLKGPLGSFMNFTDHIQQNIGNYDPEELVKIINSMNKSSRQSYRLLVNLLDWSRTQTGNLHIEPEQIKLRELVDEQLEMVEGNAFNKKINLQVSIPDTLEMYADRTMLQAISRNLITNAVKYCTEGDQVIISAFSSDGYTVLEIEDTGIGMTESQLNFLNNPHSIHSTPGTNNESGTGLGFLIVSDFVEKHKGKLEITSEVGKGTKVSIRFPSR